MCGIESIYVIALKQSRFGRLCGAKIDSDSAADWISDGPSYVVSCILDLYHCAGIVRVPVR